MFYKSNPPKDGIEYFVGKPCTIFTVGINREFTTKGEFNEIQFSDFFMGFVDKITPDEIWLTHPVTKCRTLINKKYYVSIVEEQIKDSKDPKVQEVMKSVKQQPKLTDPQNFVSIDSLKNHSKEVKEKWQNIAPDVTAN